MNTEQDLRTLLRSKGNTIITQTPPVETVRRRADQIRAHHFATLVGVLVVVAAAVTGTTLLSSPPDFAGNPVRSDGPKLTWEEANIDARANEQIVSITPFAGGLFALGTTGPETTIGWVSADGQTWDRVEVDFLTEHIAAVDNGMLAAGMPSSDPGNPFAPTIATVWSSAEGRTWEGAALPLPAITLSDPAVNWTAHVLDLAVSDDEILVFGRLFLGVPLQERLAPVMGVSVETFLNNQYQWSIGEGEQVIVTTADKETLFETTLTELDVPSDVRQAMAGDWFSGALVGWISDDGGSSWELIERPFGTNPEIGADRIVGTADGFFALGLLGDSGDPGVWFSRDGRTWENREVSGPGAGWLRSPTYWNGQMLAIDHDGQAAWASRDGRDWKRLDLDTLLRYLPSTYRLGSWDEKLPGGEFGILIEAFPAADAADQEALLLFSQDGTSWSIQPLDEAFGAGTSVTALAVIDDMALAAVQPYDPNAPVQDSEFTSEPGQIWIGRLP